MEKNNENLKKLRELRIKDGHIKRRIKSVINKQVINHFEITRLKSDSVTLAVAIANLERDLLENLIA
jgi:hypothetical protein